ncbi:DUF6892 domain-containing protein [Nocardia sp. R6R-6]|uniref:DUF6892 domain-containing protein n=1 Tax=Nocardia sp. R6R-6 TaxID=3459303 RepID=UPI00403E10B4
MSERGPRTRARQFNSEGAPAFFAKESAFFAKELDLPPPIWWGVIDTHRSDVSGTPGSREVVVVVYQRYFERVTRFVDFSIKLAVIDELMYGDSPKLAPWSLEDTLEARGFDGDLWEYSFDNYRDQVMPEARTYFESLELSADLLGGVEQLIFDGGCQVYLECCPHWDGESDQFDVASLDDLHLLPNLKRVIGADRLAPQLQAFLRSRGIELID